MCNIQNHKSDCLCHPPSQLGKKRRPETIEKLRLSHQGSRPWRKGVPNLKMRGSRHPLWRGEEVGYEALHAWIYRKLGKPKQCENSQCRYPRKDSDGRLMKNPKRYEWANIDGKYTRNLSKYKSLCPSCHRKYDMGLLTIKFTQ